MVWISINDIQYCYVIVSAFVLSTVTSVPFHFTMHELKQWINPIIMIVFTIMNTLYLVAIFHLTATWLLIPILR